MANESCDPAPAPSEPVKPGTRMVHCVKFDKTCRGWIVFLEGRDWQARVRKRFERGVEAVAGALQDGDERIPAESA